MEESNNVPAGFPVMRVVAIVVVLLIAGFAVYASQNDKEAVVQNNEVQEEGSVQPPAPVVQEDVAVFEVEGGMLYFTPKDMNVKKGQTVRIVFNNKEGLHDWVIDEFSARTPVIKAGETSTIEFVADKTGNFEYYCSVGNHRVMGMKGILTVAD